MLTNCPNCGAPIEPYKCKCEYCGTYYFDFTAFDMSGDKPYYVKFKTPYGVITTLAKPELKTIDISSEYDYAIDGLGNYISRFTKSHNCDLSVNFRAYVDPESKTLFTLDTGNKYEN